MKATHRTRLTRAGASSSRTRLKPGKETDLKIPPVPKELILPVRSLANAAYLLRQLMLVSAAEGRAVKELLLENEPSVRAADMAIETWCKHFGIPEANSSPSKKRKS